VDSLERYVNTSISSIYEPGSVFKSLTLAAALDAHLIRCTDSYDDRGEIIVGEQRILNSDRKAHGPTKMTELLAYSRNVGAAYVATLLGEARFYEYVRRFGFGEVTGIDLAHEEDGILRVPGERTWHKSDLATNSFGQGIAATPIQVVAAYGAMANDGVLMRPNVVSEIHRGEEVEIVAPFPVRRVISSQGAQDISELMGDAMDLGMKKAVLPGYVLAGKSGTSEIPNQEGYQRENIIASFVGYGPLPDPRFVVLTKFDEPKEGYWGTDVAAPEFRKMCKYLVDYYGIPPTR
jgi:cell division protein FtsI/penicillin-binding protein 2